MSLSAEWCGVPAPPRASRSLASRGSNAATGASVAWRHPKAAAAASPRCRRSASEVVCARKPTRLSNNKKKAKREAAKRGKSKGGGVRAGDGSVSPQQRVDAANHEARRWLGQHFLIDQSVILDAVAAADVRAGDRILEIGPGTGNLTVELLKAGARVDAVEKDRSLADKLAEQFRDEAALTVHRADFLKWDVEGAFRGGASARDAGADGAADERGGVSEAPMDADALDASVDSRAKVVANIPYNITTDILKTLLPMGDTFGNMVFMFQEEVARRLIKDEAGNSDYRPMSVRVHYYSTPYYIRPVTAACFDPPPNVESCLIGFRPRRPEEYLELNGTERQFFAFVQACFAQKRKMLKNNLKAVCDEETIAAAYEALGKQEKTRAQELTMPEYVRLFNFVRDRGQARAAALAAGQNVRVAPAGDEERENANARKPTKKQRETSRKVQRATSRLLAQAVESKGSAAADEH